MNRRTMTTACIRRKKISGLGRVLDNIAELPEDLEY